MRVVRMWKKPVARELGRRVLGIGGGSRRVTVGPPAVDDSRV
jgi:hypothetical protein